MRKIFKPQLEFGQIPIPDIELDCQSRDEIPKILIGLQTIYCDKEIRSKVFEILIKLIPEDVNPKNGREGMVLWKILVLGVIRLGCDWDYDKLMDIANNHKTLRLMLGHGGFQDDYTYRLQTLKDNISLFTPEILDEINTVIVGCGHNFLKAGEKDLKTSCDSFVLETDVHFPTDINLLLDCLRKIIFIIVPLCFDLGITKWRQGKFNFKKIKQLYRKIQQMKRSTSKNPKKKAERDQLIIDMHNEYLKIAKAVVAKAKETLSNFKVLDIYEDIKINELIKYFKYAEKLINQIQKRVIDGETIPHNEKMFSIFEEHTEWISKGKAGVPQQLGIRICIIRDQYGFILHHKVMENKTDDKVTVPMVFEAKTKFKNIKSCSFDKGFYSPANQKELTKILDKVILPQKGKLSEKRKAIEYAEEFLEARRQHSAVESSIGALQNHGLKKCPDHGIDGFKRYVGLGILARNIQILGHAVQQKELKYQKKGTQALKRTG